MLLTIFWALCALAVTGLLIWAIAAGPRRLAFALAMLALSALPAAAGAFDAFITAATPGLIDLIGVGLAALIGWAANTARKRWGIEIEAKHREAPQSAILNGARLALEGKLTGASAIQLILSHVQASVPGAVIALQPSREVLENLAKAKLQEAAQVIGSDKLSEAMREALQG